jgi:uncharacterized protein YqgV (UPF0045/DUF77 family)
VTSESDRAAGTLELEFTVEPFQPGSPGAHVRAAEAAARESLGEGADVVIGPFGASVLGPPDSVLKAVAAVVRAAIAEGASRVTLQVSTGAAQAVPAAER